MDMNEEKEAIASVNETLLNAGSGYRLCPVCGKVVTEGYYYSGTEYCCSDECGAEFEGVPEEEYVNERDTAQHRSEWSEGYWKTVD